MSRRRALSCSFCDTDESECRLIAGPRDVFACERCIELMWQIVCERNTYGPPPMPVYDRPSEPRLAPANYNPVPEVVDWTRPGFVYFFHAPTTNRIKIGYSLNPTGRLADILTSTPESVVDLGHIRAAYRDEKALHQRFGHIRVHREWFEATPELLAYIKEAAG